MPSWRKIPKVELHLHADCSLSSAAIDTLTVDLTNRERQDYFPPSRVADLPEFLIYASRMVKLLQTEQSLRLMIRDVMKQVAEENCIYAELRFAPHQHLENGLSPTQVVEIVNDELSSAQKITGVTARLILCSLMHFDTQTSIEVVRLVEHFAGTNVVAFDIAGDSANFSFDAHKPATDLARVLGVQMTIHAGESVGPESVAFALDRLGAQRIGHGFRAVDDPKLLQRLIRDQIHLELCPQNNIQTGNVLTLLEHPITRLRDLGAAFSISSDSRALTGDLTREYLLLSTNVGWTAMDFFRANLMALDAAFLDEENKSRLKDRLTSEVF